MGWRNGWPRSELATLSSQEEDTFEGQLQEVAIALNFDL